MISSYFGPCHQVDEISCEIQNCTQFIITIRVLYLCSTSIRYHGNLVTDFPFIRFSLLLMRLKIIAIEEVDRENEILMNSVPKNANRLFHVKLHISGYTDE